MRTRKTTLRDQKPQRDPKGGKGNHHHKKISGGGGSSSDPSDVDPIRQAPGIRPPL